MSRLLQPAVIFLKEVNDWKDTTRDSVYKISLLNKTKTEILGIN